VFQTSNKAYIAFGANLSFEGNSPASTLNAACRALEGKGVRLHKFSRLWQSPAWPDPKEPDYVNAVALFSTHLPPFLLLQNLRRVERQFGRLPGRRNAPRTLDLDLLSYGHLHVRFGHLILPHPRMHEREFVLFPLQDIAPDWRMPHSGKKIDVLINTLSEHQKNSIYPLSSP
jgi:2-amino-4-hydroxy-6-hydroxymethyldihydropteridine diphosphokinase